MGVTYAILARAYPVSCGDAGQGLAVPTLVAALLATGAAVILFEPPSWLAGTGLGPLTPGLWPLACAALAVSCGAARQRWRSVWTAALLHAAGAVLAAIAISLVRG